MAYSQAPRRVGTLVMGLYWMAQGLGSFLGTGLLRALHNVFVFAGNDFGDINCKLNAQHVDISALPLNATDRTPVHSCHLDYYFFVLALLQLVGIGFFIVASLKLDVGGAPRESVTSSMTSSSRYGSRTSSYNVADSTRHDCVVSEGLMTSSALEDEDEDDGIPKSRRPNFWAELLEES